MSETTSIQESMANMIHRLKTQKGLDIHRVRGDCPLHGHFQAFSIRGAETGCPTCILERQREIDDQENFDIANDHGLITFWQGGVLVPQIPPRFTDATFASYIPTCPEQEEIRDAMIRYANDFKPRAKDHRNIIMSGNVGTGKTHLAIALGRALAEYGFRTAYLTIFDLMQPSQRDSAEGIHRTIAQLNTYDMVILDEIGAHPDFGFSSELVTTTLFQLIDSRYMNCLSTVIITNIGAAELATSKAGLGDRAMDRIKDAVVFKFMWTSSR